jgi:hypothetical protein
MQIEEKCLKIKINQRGQNPSLPLSFLYYPKNGLGEWL